MNLPVCVRYHSPVAPAVLLDHIRNNSALGLPVVRALGGDLPPLAVVAGGPSLSGDIPKLRHMDANGARILAVNEVPRHLLQYGIKSWAAAHVGPVDLTLRSMGEPIAGVIYFMASTCPPAAFQLLEEHDVVLWHPDIEETTGIQFDGAKIHGGTAIGLSCLALGHALGFRDIHFFGGDSSFEPSGSFHAYDSVADAIGHREILVASGGRTFATTPELLGQALHFPKVRGDLVADGTVLTIHGDGLLPFRERCRMIENSEPDILVTGGYGLQPNASGIVEIDAQMF